METILIKIIDVNLDNNLISFEINNKYIFCIDKSFSYSIKELIKNIFIIAINQIEGMEKNFYEISNIDSIEDGPINYNSLEGCVYNIEYNKKEITIINYEVKL